MTLINWRFSSFSRNSQPQTRTGKQVCLIGITVFLLTGLCLSQSPSDWPQFHNTNMQRFNPNETVLNVNNVGNLQLKWSYASGGAPSDPAVANGVVYFSSGGKLYALNASTGALLWSAPYGGSSPAVASGLVYVGSGKNVYALNASTGALLWTYPTVSGPSTPAVTSGVVYVGSGNNVYALSANAGALLWSYATGGGVPSPAVANGVVYAGSGDGNLYALNANTGAELWSYPTGTPGPDSPVVADGVVYIDPQSGNLHALDASTGALLWTYPVGDTRYSATTPAVANGVVYAGSYKGPLCALNAKTGALLWSVYNSEIPVYSPAVANGVVYGGSDWVAGWDAATGVSLWEYDFAANHPPSSASSSVAVANGMVYIGVGNGDLDAFSLSGADLNLRLVDYPTPVVQGALLTYAFKIWNLGPEIATHEVLTTQVPTGTTFSSISISGTPGIGSCTHPAVGASGPVICKEGSRMAPNTTWTVRMTVQVTAPVGTVITQTAKASEDTLDPNLANNVAIVRNTVQ